MNLNPQQRFWQNPDVIPEELDGMIAEGYQEYCKPDYYIMLNSISQYLCNLIGVYMPVAMIVEFGCGVGRNLHFLQERGHSIAGVEINPECKKIARKHFSKVAPFIHIAPAEESVPLFQTNGYDIVLTQGFLMHVPHENNWIIKEMCRIASQYIVTNEVENANTPGVRFARNYKDHIEKTGVWRQVAELTKINVPAIRT